MRPIDINRFSSAYNSGLNSVPVVASMFADENINLYVKGSGNYTIITKDKKIEKAAEGLSDDPTVNVFTDVDTVQQIVNERLSVMDALDQEKITFEGVGVFKSIKMGVLNFAYNVYSLFAGKESEELTAYPEPSDCPLVKPEQVSS
jgi:hypothetical protein